MKHPNALHLIADWAQTLGQGWGDGDYDVGLLQTVLKLAAGKGNARDCDLWLEVFPGTIVRDAEVDLYRMGPVTGVIEMPGSNVRPEDYDWKPHEPLDEHGPFHVEFADLYKALLGKEWAA